MYHPKVIHSEEMNSHITPMISGGFQPPFIAGGNQVAYYLGVKGNYPSHTQPDMESAYEKVMRGGVTTTLVSNGFQEPFFVGGQGAYKKILRENQK